MWWSTNELILAVEIMKYMNRTYQEYLNTPYEILQTILIRMDLENKTNPHHD